MKAEITVIGELESGELCADQEMRICGTPSRLQRDHVRGAFGREQLRTGEGQSIVAALIRVPLFRELLPLPFEKCFGISASIG